MRFKLQRVLGDLAARRSRARLTEDGSGLVFLRPGTGDITRLVLLQAASSTLADLPADPRSGPLQ